MIDFKMGQRVTKINNTTRYPWGEIIKIMEQYDPHQNSLLNRMPDLYQVKWIDGTITQEDQWTIDPLPFDPNEILKKIT